MKGEPFRTISSLELMGVLTAVMVFSPRGQMEKGARHDPGAGHHRQPGQYLYGGKVHVEQVPAVDPGDGAGLPA